LAANAKKVIFLLSANDFGGVTNFSLNLIKEMQKSGVECQIHVPFFTHFYYTKNIRAKRNLTDIKMWIRYFLGQFRLELKERRFKFCGEKLGILDIKANRYLFRPSKRLLKNARFVIIQQSGLLQQLIGLGLDFERIIIVVHHSFTNNILDLKNKEGKLANIVASSTFTGKILSELGADKLDLIPLGVDTELYNPTNRTRFDDGNIHIGFYYHPHSRKNPDLVKFLVQYFSSYEDIKFIVHIFGHKFKTDIASNNLIFHKLLSEIQYSREIANLDVFVFCSNMEGFALPPLEAMSSGVSVVTSRVGAVSDYMNDSYGIIIDPESSSIIWINAILEVSRHKLIRDQFSVNARQGAENFSWSQTSNLYLNLMDRLESSR